MKASISFVANIEEKARIRAHNIYDRKYESIRNEEERHEQNADEEDEGENTENGFDSDDSEKYLNDLERRAHELGDNIGERACGED